MMHASTWDVCGGVLFYCSNQELVTEFGLFNCNKQKQSWSIWASSSRSTVRVDLPSFSSIICLVHLYVVMLQLRKVSSFDEPFFMYADSSSRLIDVGDDRLWLLTFRRVSVVECLMVCCSEPVCTTSVLSFMDGVATLGTVRQCGDCKQSNQQPPSVHHSATGLGVMSRESHVLQKSLATLYVPSPSFPGLLYLLRFHANVRTAYGTPLDDHFMHDSLDQFPAPGNISARNENRGGKEQGGTRYVLLVELAWSSEYEMRPKKSKLCAHLRRVRNGLMTQVYSGVLATVVCFVFLWRTERMKSVYIEGIILNNAKINDRFYQFRNMQVPFKQSLLVPVSLTMLFVLSGCEAYAQHKMLDAFLESLQRQSTGVQQRIEKGSTNKIHPADRRPYFAEHELISGDRLAYMFVIHENVAKLAEFINSAYSLQIIAIVTVTFVNTLFGFFIETKMFKSASLLHKLLQYKSNYFIDDQALFERSKAIALQLLHRKRFSLFNGSGLFKLDFTFIFSIFSAATSYLIVLLQFDLSKDLQKATIN
uniref:Gustatory receptor n=1 Tax=Anopheles atroparvus TaxID=41427 RepID=A0A182JIU4_ANOAO